MTGYILSLTRSNWLTTVRKTILLPLPDINPDLWIMSSISDQSLYSLYSVKFMNVRLTNYFEKFHILSTREFEFQKGKSCSDAIVRLADYIYIYMLLLMIKKSCLCF